MAITIQRLQCYVHVVAGTENPILHQGNQGERPSMDFAMTMGEATVEREDTGPEDSASVGGSHGRQESIGSPGEVDAQKVTDRVYELMRQEVLLGRARGGASEYAKRR